MEPTDALFMTIVKIVLITIFAIIPFIFGVFANISTKHHRATFIAGKTVSILLTIFIIISLSISVIFAIKEQDSSQRPYIFAWYICWLLIAIFPLSTFDLTTSQKTKKQKTCYLTISFITFFLILSGSEFLYNRAFGYVFQTERFELSINDFYSNHPEADKNSDINIFASIQNGEDEFTANISVYKDSITLKATELRYISSEIISSEKSQKDSCYRNDLPRDLVQDIIEEITYYQPEIEYTWVGDLCFHPFAFIELANNKNANTIILKLPNIDEYHPNAQRLAKKIKSLAKDSKIDPTKGCSN
jgi:hypothetical protein